MYRNCEFERKPYERFDLEAQAKRIVLFDKDRRIVFIWSAYYLKDTNKSLNFSAITNKYVSSFDALVFDI
ncbi:hypothetical protein B5G41_07045 [Alistipes onderdonkii]|uniref:Uncharacterized protein n=1 Tax=Alistipes onderdonkii TaxID=328813 RepID=A0A1Y3QV04_9BACT|nr:hypothetical protein B5G41_07045 [Alistipes onderdonkii]